MRVVVVTHFVSPYQAELFNAVAALGGLDLEVIYLHGMFRTRRWTIPSLSHQAVCLDEQPGRFEEVLANFLGTDLAVFNYYSERMAQLLLNARAVRKKPWCLGRAPWIP